MALEEIRSERLKKRDLLKQDDHDPYPASSRRTHAIADALRKFAPLLRGKKAIVIAGRVMAKREHGGATFMDLQDHSGQMQIYFKKDVLGEQSYALLEKTVDIGDFLETEGKVFETKKGEKTIEAIQWQMLTKSLLPLPEKWYGLQDVEERFRKRYLDLIMNTETRARFALRSSMISALRRILDKNGFLEVETPMFHPIAGGALAKPFTTHHHALDIDLYLRVAPELYLKRLLVGGFERVYEIGKDFRNEGMDATHNPEFTMLECYAAYWDEGSMMQFVEEMVSTLADECLGDTGGLEREGKHIAFKRPFTRITFRDLLARYALIPDYDAETRDSLAMRARQLGIDSEPQEPKGKIADEIYKKICRPYLVQPTFLTHHPLDISPLAKKTSPQASEVRRFQLVIAGVELANGFSELNDPLEQRMRFEEQEQIRQGGEDEAHRLDEEFLEALEYGMPPAAGLGVGIDRLAMFFADVKNIREVILFPTMRLKESH